MASDGTYIDKDSRDRVSFIEPHECLRQSWLITGGCGFIGTSLIAHLRGLNPDIGIRVLDNLSVGTRDDLSEVSPFIEKSADSLPGRPSGTELVVGDIRDFDTCMKGVRGIDIVVHLAAQVSVPDSVEGPIFDMDVNVKGTLNMLESCRLNNVMRFVFASSAAPLGDVEQPVHEERAPRPVAPYGASKLAGEGYCSSYFRTFGIRTVALRFGNLYGPRSKHKSSVVAKFFRNALNDEPLEIFGDGKQTRDFIFMDDLIQAVMLAVRTDAGGEVFQIATHKETTVNEIADLVKEIVEKETGKAVSIVHGEQRLGDIRRNFSDISKAKKILGYEPAFDLRSGLMRTFEYFRGKD